MLSKILEFFGLKSKEKEEDVNTPAAWPFPTAENRPTAPVVEEKPKAAAKKAPAKPKAKKATTKKAPAKAKPKTTKKATTKTAAK